MKSEPKPTTQQQYIDGLVSTRNFYDKAIKRATEKLASEPEEVEE